MYKIALLCLVFLLSNASSHAQSDFRLTEDEKTLYVSAMYLLSDNDYSILEIYHKKNHVHPIVFLYDKQLSVFSNDPATLNLLRSKSMFTLGERSQLPLYIRRESKFYKSLLDDYKYTKGIQGVTVHPSVMALSAKISHEIFHFTHPELSETDEEAVKHEISIFEKLVKVNEVNLNITNLRYVTDRHKTNLLLDLQLAIKERR